MDSTISKADRYDDPIWEYTLYTKLQPYIEPARQFWKHIYDIQITGTGIYNINEPDTPPGFMYRCTSTPVRSPIKHVQVFPFVPVAYLQISNVPGGATKMVTRVCEGNRFKIEEFTCVEKSNLPSTYHQGQFIAFVPTDILEGAQDMGKWVYLTRAEMRLLLTEPATGRLAEKFTKYL